MVHYLIMQMERNAISVVVIAEQSFDELVRRQTHKKPVNGLEGRKMSYRSVADENRDDVIEHLTNACDALSSIVVDKCGGYEELKPEYRQTLRDVLADLLNQRAKLELE